MKAYIKKLLDLEKKFLKLKPTPSRELGHNCPSRKPNFSILKWPCLTDGKGLGDNFGTYGLLSTHSIL